MADKVLMLAKNYDLKKLVFPLVLTEKLDGAASDFYALPTHGVNARSRQAEPLYSVDHITLWLTGKLLPGDHLICELFVEGGDFKDISGMVRSHDTQPKLKAYVYDFYTDTVYTGGDDMSEITYSQRMKMMANRVGKHVTPDSPVQIIPGHQIQDVIEFQDAVESFFKAKPKAEGLMIRSLFGKESGYNIGKRSWGMQRLKPTGTMDLQVHSFEEAIDGEGNPKGMVGRINVLLSIGADDDGKNTFSDYRIIGAGPGALTHSERIAIWDNQKQYIGRIAEIAYKPDDTYDALREARFSRWRDDKSEPNQE